MSVRVKAIVVAAWPIGVALAYGCSSSSNVASEDFPIPDRDGSSAPVDASGGGPRPDDASSDAPADAADGAPNLAAIGCADGTREAFVDAKRYPRVAGCAGGFTVAGVITNASKAPACARAGGNDGKNPNGTGCSVEDLCAAGWHVCSSRQDFQAAADGGPCDPAPGFFVTRQAQGPGGACVVNGINNLVGCGTLGRAADNSCTPLLREMLLADCQAAPPWTCPNTQEPSVVTKPGPLAGGAICCHD